MKDTQVGTLIDSNAQRDAIHCAIAPVQMGDDVCQPGTHVGLLDSGTVSEDASKLIGIVDPFLKKPVRKGEWCWLFLYPKTVTGMRHHWQHPAFSEAPSNPVEDSKRWLENIAEQCGVSYGRMMSAIEHDDYISMGENETYKDVIPYDEFKKHIKIVTGKDYVSVPFSCSC